MPNPKVPPGDEEDVNTGQEPEEPVIARTQIRGKGIISAASETIEGIDDESLHVLSQSKRELEITVPEPADITIFAPPTAISIAEKISAKIEQTLSVYSKQPGYELKEDRKGEYALYKDGQPIIKSVKNTLHDTHGVRAQVPPQNIQNSLQIPNITQVDPALMQKLLEASTLDAPTKKIRIVCGSTEAALAFIDKCGKEAKTHEFEFVAKESPDPAKPIVIDQVRILEKINSIRGPSKPISSL